MVVVEAAVDKTGDRAPLDERADRAIFLHGRPCAGDARELRQVQPARLVCLHYPALHRQSGGGARDNEAHEGVPAHLTIDQDAGALAADDDATALPCLNGAADQLRRLGLALALGHLDLHRAVCRQGAVCVHTLSSIHHRDSRPVARKLAAQEVRGGHGGYRNARRSVAVYLAVVQHRRGAGVYLYTHIHTHTHMLRETEG